MNGMCKQAGQYNEAPKAEIGYASVGSKIPALQERAEVLSKEFATLYEVMYQLIEKTAPIRVCDITPTPDKAVCEGERHSPMWNELNNAISRIVEIRVMLARLCEVIE